MIYDLSEVIKQNEAVEKRLLSMKEDYQKPQMSDEQFEKLYRTMKEAKISERKERTKQRTIKVAATAAALVGAFVILPNTSATIAHAMEQIPIVGQLVEAVTIREYEYDSDRFKADIDVTEIKVENQAEDSKVQENLDRTTEEINAEIQKITDELIAQFEADLKQKEGYQDIVVKSEVLTTTPDYFTLKLLCYWGAGSGYQWNYYYTIDLNTGERLELKDIFVDGADYITPISENIKAQMQAQMDADEMVHYWLNDEIEDLNFKAITDDTSFYLNERGNVVIGFNEGDVAPMYMGCVEFEIPSEILSGIRK
ncbi:MAG: RsiV family protein [Acetatifactor sp.]